MSFHVEKRYQDIAFFNIEKKAEAPAKKSNPFVIIAVTALATAALLAIGYCAGWAAGVFSPPCCIGALDFDFNFESGAAPQLM